MSKGAANVVLVLVCLYLGLGQSEASWRALRQTPATTGTAASTGVTASPFYARASSCASASASSTGGSASASSTATSATNAPLAFAAASAASIAVADLCSGGDAVALTTVFAEACAETLLKVTLSTTSNAASTSLYGRACATGCASGESASAAMSRAIVNASAVATGNCAGVTADATASTVAGLVSKLGAASFTYACAQGRGKASAVAQLAVTQMSQAYASAMGTIIAAACGCKSCKCSKPALATQSNSEALAQVQEGKYALTTAISNAASNICRTTKAGTPARASSIAAAAQTCLEGWANSTIKIYGTSVLNTSTTGNASLACAITQINSANTIVAEAGANMMAEAWATAFKGKCNAAANAFSSSTLFLNNTLNAIYTATRAVCVKNGGKAASVADVSKTISNNQAFADAVSDAFSNVVNDCGCSGAPWCSSGADWTQSCPGLAGNV